MAFKKERMEKILEREISNIIFQEVKNEKIKFVTITKASLTNDLSLATIYYTVYGNNEQIEATVEALRGRDSQCDESDPSRYHYRNNQRVFGRS